LEFGEIIFYQKNKNHKPQAGTAPVHRPGQPARTGRRSSLAARRSPIADRPSASVSFVRSVEDEDGCAGCCCFVRMCVHDVSPTSTVHHSHDRAVICHHTMRACAYHENLAASASCFMSTTSSSQGRRTCSTAQPMVGRAEASKRATRAADYLSGTFEPRTEGGWRVVMWFQAGVRRRRGDQDACRRARRAPWQISVRRVTFVVLALRS